MKKIIVTGSSGLIGSETATYFEKRGFYIIGVDNNMRSDFFGPKGDTLWNLKRISKIMKNFTNYNLDIRNREAVLNLVKENTPDAIIHCAAQPSHDLAASRPFDDFDINAGGTLNILEATRRYCPEAPFIFMSTNKVYGDAPNYIPLKENTTRWEYANEKYKNGIAEDFPIDHSKHSLFGASKVAADIMTQEYGRYFNMPTVCLRGGCLTGPAHSGVELHGFLSYLVKTIVKRRKYTVYGYKGKQVRDQIHSYDVVRAFEEFINNPACAKVYNLGGGIYNNASILECISLIENISGKKANWEYSKKNRIGDHICYISDLRNLMNDYSNWSVTKNLESIVEELVEFETNNHIFDRES